MDVLLWISNKKMPHELNRFLPLIGTKPLAVGWGVGWNKTKPLTIRGRNPLRKFPGVMHFH